MSEGAGKKTRLVACRVFEPALKGLEIKKRYPGLLITYLPSKLHLRPQVLKEYIKRELAGARKRGERAVCLYGECFPDIDEVCRRFGAARVPGIHCHEMLLGSGRFQELTRRGAGIYFVEQELIINFDEYCLEPLELHDEEMKQAFFEPYRKLLYVRQPQDPDLLTRAEDLASFLGLAFSVEDADYSHLEERLKDFV